jgi:phosphoribosylamine--glycine ligase
MKVLVIGGGGKEHAIVWKLSLSKHINKIYCCPGNAGIAEIAECIDVSPGDFSALIDFVKYEWIDFTIVGSEELSSRGVVYAFEKEGCRIFGPNKTAVQVNSSRYFSKNLMRLHRIPGAEFKVFSSYLHAEDYVRLKGAPLIIKTESRLKGDGVFIASTVDEARDALKLIMKERILGDAGKQVIIEESLKGERISFLIFTDGNSIMPLSSLSAYSDISLNDMSSNAFKPGAYSPVPFVTKELEAIIMGKIMRPVLKALNAQGTKYNGIISADLIVDENRPYVFDLTCSFGDLEAQAVLARLKTDFTNIVLAVLGGRLSEIAIEWEQNASVCVAISGKGRPEKYQKGIVINGLEKIKTMENTFIFHENTSFRNTNIVTSGRRVITITGLGPDIKTARTKAYEAAEKIHFDGMYYRTDIGNIL